MEEDGMFSSIPYDSDNEHFPNPGKESWPPVDHPQLSEQEQAIVWEEVQVNKVHSKEQPLVLPPPEGLDDPEEAESQWGPIILPVYPMIHPSVALSFATVQWDMPAPSSETAYPTADNSLADELDSCGAARLDFTPLTNSRSIHAVDIDTELTSDEDTQYDDGLEELQPLNSTVEEKGSVSQPCDMLNTEEETKRTTQEEEDPVWELPECIDTDDGLAEISLSDIEEEDEQSVTEEAVEPAETLVITEEGIVGSEPGVERQNVVDSRLEEEQEKPDILLTGQSDLEQEPRSATVKSLQTEEQHLGRVEDETYNEEREETVTNIPGNEENKELVTVLLNGPCEKEQLGECSNHIGLIIKPDQPTHSGEFQKLTVGWQLENIQIHDNTDVSNETVVEPLACEVVNHMSNSEQRAEDLQQPELWLLTEICQEEPEQNNQAEKPVCLEPPSEQTKHCEETTEHSVEPQDSDPMHLENSEPSEQSQPSNWVASQYYNEYSNESTEPELFDQSQHREQSEQSQQPEKQEQTEQSQHPEKEEQPEHEEQLEKLEQSEQLEKDKQSEQSQQTEKEKQTERAQHLEKEEQSELVEQPEQSEQLEREEQSEQPEKDKLPEESKQPEKEGQTEESEQPEKEGQTEESDQPEKEKLTELPEQPEKEGQPERSKQSELIALMQHTAVTAHPVQVEGSKQSDQSLQMSSPSPMPSTPSGLHAETNRTGEKNQAEHRSLDTEFTQEKRQTENSPQNIQLDSRKGAPMQTVVSNGGPPELAQTLEKKTVVDREKACCLAERLYRLDGIQPKDVVRHLDKDNDFSRAVGEEYLKFFDFTGQTLDSSLRSFLKVVLLIGETQERERVLQHFSCRFHQCNPDSFSDAATVLTLTCALMLLNSDLHGQNVGKAMSTSDFVSNLNGMDEGQNFSKELLKNFYSSIKNEPLEWAVDEEELKSSMLLEDDAKEDAPARCKSNPFQDVPHNSKAKVFKQGFLQRKTHADIDGKRTPWGKRSWKTFYGVLRGMVLYLHKDEYKKEYDSTEEVVSVHHALAEPAINYTKKPHVFRLQTADWRVFLFQASSRAEMSSWINRVNLASALHSSPPFPAAVGSQRRFCRPILPASQSAHTLERQLQSHAGMLESFQSDLTLLRQNLPEGRRAKAKDLEEHRVREDYLQHEICRYEIYMRVLEAWKGLNMSADATVGAKELTLFDKALSKDLMGDEDEEVGLKKSHSSPSLDLEMVAPTPLAKVKRNISERRTYRKTVIPRRNKIL